MTRFWHFFSYYLLLNRTECSEKLLICSSCVLQEYFLQPLFFFLFRSSSLYNLACDALFMGSTDASQDPSWVGAIICRSPKWLSSLSPLWDRVLKGVISESFPWLLSGFWVPRWKVDQVRRELLKILIKKSEGEKKSKKMYLKESKCVKWLSAFFSGVRYCEKGTRRWSFSPIHLLAACVFWTPPPQFYIFFF